MRLDDLPTVQTLSQTRLSLTQRLNLLRTLESDRYSNPIGACNLVIVSRHQNGGRVDSSISNEDAQIFRRMLFDLTKRDLNLVEGRLRALGVSF